MKLLWLTPEIPIPTNNGHRVVYCNRIKAMSRIGHKIYLCSFVEEDFELAYEKELKEFCYMVNLFKRKKIAITYKDFWLPHYILKRECSQLKEKINSILENEEIDILMIESTNMVQYLPRQLSQNILTVFSVHNIDYILLWRSALVRKNINDKFKQFFESLKTMHYEHDIYKNNLFDVYIFLSEHERKYITSRYRYIRTLFSPIGVSDIAVNESHNKTNKKKRILFLGNLSYFCNIEGISWFVNKVYPIVISNINNVSLYLVGKKPTEEIYALAQQYRDIKIIPDVDNISPILAKADIVIAPIISGGGVKVKILDALSAKKLVVSTKMGIEGTSLKDQKHLLVVNDFNEKEFALRCVEGLLKKNEYSHIINEGHKYVIYNHDWNKIIRELCHNLNKIFKQKRSQLYYK